MTPTKKQVLVVGCGGIGTIAALNLHSGNLAEVSCVLRSNYDVVKERGFAIRSCEHGNIDGWRPDNVLKAVPQTSEAAGLRRFDYVVCCTKNIPGSSPSLCDILAPAVSPEHTTIVLIQNGLNIEKAFLSRFPRNVVLSGVSRVDAHEVAPGSVEQKQPDLLHIGAFQSPTLSPEVCHSAAEGFVRLYGAGGKTTCLHRPDVGYDRWCKLVYNASFNPVCALTGLDTSELQAAAGVMDGLVVPAMNEVVNVAQAVGYRLPGSIVDDTIRSNPVEDRVAPSMLVDLRKGNLIEHENILGEVVRVAGEAGAHAPILATLYSLCCGVQERLRNHRQSPGV